MNSPFLEAMQKMILEELGIELTFKENGPRISTFTKFAKDEYYININEKYARYYKLSDAYSEKHYDFDIANPEFDPQSIIEFLRPIVEE